MTPTLYFVHFPSNIYFTADNISLFLNQKRKLQTCCWYCVKPMVVYHVCVQRNFTFDTWERKSVDFSDINILVVCSAYNVNESNEWGYVVYLGIDVVTDALRVCAFSFISFVSVIKIRQAYVICKVIKRAHKHKHTHTHHTLAVFVSSNQKFTFHYYERVACVFFKVAQRTSLNIQTDIVRCASRSRIIFEAI